MREHFKAGCMIERKNRIPDGCGTLTRSSARTVQSSDTCSGPGGPGTTLVGAEKIALPVDRCLRHDTNPGRSPRHLFHMNDHFGCVTRGHPPKYPSKKYRAAASVLRPTWRRLEGMIGSGLLGDLISHLFHDPLDL